MRGLYLKAGLVLVCAAAWSAGCAVDSDLFLGEGELGAGGASNAGSTSGTSTSSTTSGPGPGSGGGGSGQGGGGGSTGPGPGSGGMTGDVGCSDGTREYYESLMQRPNIAGCEGGFQVAGVTTQGSRSPQCGRVAGNNSSNQAGLGCSVEDLCASGWHVCDNAEEVATATNGAGCESSTSVTPEFWLTRQVQTAQGVCAGPPNENNITGCGNLGYLTQPSQSCAPLERAMRYIECQSNPTWSCGSTTENVTEAAVVTKGPGAGGVLCCRD